MLFLKIFDVLCRLVRTLVNQKLGPGTYEVEFDGSDLASGIYFYRLEAAPEGGQEGTFRKTRKMVLLK